MGGLWITPHREIIALSCEIKKNLLHDEITQIITSRHEPANIPFVSGTLTLFPLAIVLELWKWLHMLPNIKYLEFGLQEAQYWVTLDGGIKSLTFFLNRIEQLSVNCSSTDNPNFINEMAKLYLPFLTDRGVFPHLQCMRLFSCSSISTTWTAIRKWIDSILISSIAHQLRSLRFDFDDEDYHLIEMELNDKLFTNYELELHADIHRRVWPGHIEFWIEKK